MEEVAGPEAPFPKPAHWSKLRAEDRRVRGIQDDELNRLQRARRWDMADVNPDANPLPTVTDGQESVDLRYRYDADDERVIKWAHDTNTSHAVQDAYTLYPFDSLEVRRAKYNTTASPNEYELTAQTEVPYLFANGVRLARVVYEPQVPLSSSAAQHVLFELGDHLGSTSTVLDKATGELVEKSTAGAGPSSMLTAGAWFFAPWVRWWRRDTRWAGDESRL